MKVAPASADAQLAELMARESAHVRERNPRSVALTGRGQAGFYDGVPMHWMRNWPMPVPLIVAQVARRCGRFDEVVCGAAFAELPT